ncbi:hypothetical protein AVEN_72359-1 [Araneus ventricosus]|uniref:Uncharacterized protein n=1 Tax=Araneus ventricosus TaxID=182803 RepID=A0A4Y2HYF1_ARAVE|nr:hypothetical protein AVEN_239111-1 [Araneus ventricosus]GBM70572.1 hypothetical protein AVEN_72359-1 [Araneus ventricosus]
MALQNSELPSSFENEVIQTDSENTILRSNLKNISDVKAWIAEYGRNKNTKWNLRHSNPSGVRFVCFHKYVCHHSSFNKVPSSQNKRGISATITIKVKLDTKIIRKRDEHAKIDNVPLRRSKSAAAGESHASVKMSTVQQTSRL